MIIFHLHVVKSGRLRSYIDASITTSDICCTGGPLLCSCRNRITGSISIRLNLIPDSGGKELHKTKLNNRQTI